MRFLEKEELPHFKFQKDFLKPFEYTMLHNDNPDIRDMVNSIPSYVTNVTLTYSPQVLQCLQQMIQARAHNLRSGWRTMFAVFSAASKVLTGEDYMSTRVVLYSRSHRTHRKLKL
jgi:brefeldin A-inhibited guanine nucleotide-exchange protein